ncbi:T9SS type A sorting domain-containing protein [Flavivirga spongiicola]|uniref:T9SS type A sorting domain-containing protein n=1 Tax=Flavivirga spongiicola TaxID=421621 RepID=A0ABU7XQZ3_9FLAO|nr:T9SS type A sorting domain-containing protein [Flavivirga sp. MEBiC05379]MDO5978214.1 T9SS type A sorting domain-containing protein [Flavivirga sp. MEBiC05379]
MKKITILCSLLIAVCSISAQTTTFDWDTAPIDTGATVTETIDGITLTVSDALDLTFGGLGDALGTTGNVVVLVGTAPPSLPIDTSITFTFSEPVDFESIRAVDAAIFDGSDIDFTFTPTGGSNTTEIVTITGGAATVNLNWTNVTSFTVESSGSWFVFDDLVITRTTPLPITFDWDTAPIDTGATVTETIDGVTLTVSDALDLTFGGLGDALGTTGNVVVLVGTAPPSLPIDTSITFTFSEPVDFESIRAVDAAIFDGSDIDFTFTPTGGSNTTEIVTITGGAATVNLNWTNVTSFTVESSGSWFVFDDLSILKTSFLLSTEQDYKSHKAVVYPNPVQDILNIKNASDLKSIDLYNSLGQRVLQSNQKSIDMSHLSKGLYFLKIQTSQGTETKRIIKK